MKIVVFIVISILSIILWGNLYVIMDDVTEGEAYGFNVGDSKTETFDKAKLLFRNEDIHTWPSEAGECKTPSESWLSKIEFTKNCKQHLLNNDIWWFHFGDENLNNIRIIFGDGKVKSIYRHRHFMESI
jgi:hypothetical protein